MKASRAIVLFVLIMLLASLALVSVLPAGAQGVNLLQNPSFEDGVDPWQARGGTLITINNPNSGNLAAIFFVNEAEGYIHQTVPVSPEASYLFFGFAIKDNPNIDNIFLRISWYESEDGFGSEISDNDSINALTDDHPQYRPLTTGQVTPPPNAH
ncbi:MAG: hypothetical protein E3J65_05620, partial [Dehalococcoidia bacterium]